MPDPAIWRVSRSAGRARGHATMVVGAVIQARTGSTRLPGKVLLDIAGKPMLTRVVDLVRRATRVDRVIVATTDNSLDDGLAAFAAGLPCDMFRGDEHDVLDRYWRTAQQYSLDVIVRVTSDCPLIDPGLIDDVAGMVIDGAGHVDFCSNTVERRFPRGLDVEVVTRSALERLWHIATAPHWRAHVFPYVYEHPSEFSVARVVSDVDRSAMRWTIDTEEDLAFVREVYRRIEASVFSWQDIVAMLEREPELLRINESVRQKTAHER